jgi:acyl-CoA thioesterase I
VKNLLFAIGILGLALLGFFLYPIYLAETPTIVAFGDSLTYGTGSKWGGGFVKLLEEQIGLPIENLGVPGNTSADGVARIDEVLARKPTITLVLFGGNDVRKGVSPVETAKNLALIDAALKQAGSKVILIKLDVLTGVWGHPEFMSDNLHPNDKGYAIIAERIRPSLEALLPQPAWLRRGQSR